MSCEQETVGDAAPISIRERCPQLSPRERDVCLEIVRGGTCKEIGSRLGMSARTVETHRWDIFRKLGISGTAALVMHVLGNPEVVP
ncbi:LuxR C-terminal-related transcriptional regulator [Bradyrhizobium sp. HKCCYLR1023]|uniref:LuxR C-terminal-related transcriptional regulator n=1 Tax=Bradyrhizobium TaxID=374 RepID=UPI003EB76BF4